jgi:uncharacterized protein YdhG (YjbR/CyaY superfamily)
MQTVPDTDSYIAGFPEQTRIRLETLRSLIRQTVPEATETISYQMPAYKYHGILVYFAGHKSHIGFYPGPGAITHFKEELARYHTSKGTVQFALNEPIPSGLITRMVKFRVLENLAKAEAKKMRKA